MFNITYQKVRRQMELELIVLQLQLFQLIKCKSTLNNTKEFILIN